MNPGNFICPLEEPMPSLVKLWRYIPRTPTKTPALILFNPGYLPFYEAGQTHRRNTTILGMGELYSSITGFHPSNYISLSD
jgi:hypothetical protein